MNLGLNRCPEDCCLDRPDLFSSYLARGASGAGGEMGPAEYDDKASEAAPASSSRSAAILSLSE